MYTGSPMDLWCDELMEPPPRTESTPIPMGDIKASQNQREELSNTPPIDCCLNRRNSRLIPRTLTFNDEDLPQTQTTAEQSTTDVDMPQVESSSPLKATTRTLVQSAVVSRPVQRVCHAAQITRSPSMDKFLSR